MLAATRLVWRSSQGSIGRQLDNMRKLRLTDFSASKRTIERADVDEVVAEFRTFLLDVLDAGEDELPVVELE
jgi:hypothetical protein